MALCLIHKRLLLVYHIEQGDLGDAIHVAEIFVQCIHCSGPVLVIDHRRGCILVIVLCIPQSTDGMDIDDCDVSWLAGTGNALRVAQPVCRQVDVLLGPLADHVSKVGTTCRCCCNSTGSLDVLTEGLYIGIHQESQLLDTINVLFTNDGRIHCGSTPESLESLAHRSWIHVAIVVTSKSYSKNCGIQKLCNHTHGDYVYTCVGLVGKSLGLPWVTGCTRLS